MTSIRHPVPRLLPANRSDGTPDSKRIRIFKPDFYIIIGPFFGIQDAFLAFPDIARFPKPQNNGHTDHPLIFIGTGAFIAKLVSGGYTVIIPGLQDFSIKFSAY